ncbi:MULTISPECIES: tRNA (N(6)-L-threonylcarbamoyladenosine(37)-C(2))-methylthiotransferase MtaB [Dethiosulfovibrio]|uniref:tRNA (N(6)-L-threonylcarbamoyladenosine(37)-C(2))-methylthiotransferase MtaB n=2 Tax=Dethiosulfovibrio TaxID=47054 RepID=A0ABS9EKH6_9BACT|nr:MULTISPECIES: tRNA (N(6)-L-threonylcarbamoyladenosine(37)-C(2))-methylthiotransferase MtaB [Dethiosulfovibrio]MCF4113876.1 tRNA (N(6)-L-threonylcarbamoyladenosine(37)-C(2))-methylthiotransferase MtaB [Dethiosulfovibrio russensis]MCF4141711.1 tRNA (N(6)-L-threonylcarbamoyladenosine(37)-C(2))-methylthiotransferase MtaB [Dethiosulfovibrio marinus]MCF4143872.1 tRNA (N(6)-L-threonylcarbamoyladenosine(37)-C(2))-methylthiotransferase MtaB [Dethiosulfovibrio acidaminovorans]
MTEFSVRIKALGCRTNLYEADAIASAFTRAGCRITEGNDWNAAVLVSCSVTAEADRKSRQIVRRFRRASPNGLVVATGCWAQGVSDEEAKALGVDLLVGNRRKDDIVPLVMESLRGGVPDGAREKVATSSRWESLFLDRPSLTTRAFLKVQDGCDHFCSYCIIPFLRGKPVSRPLDDLEREVRSVVESGCPEIVLTGVHLGLYGRDGGPGLADLLRAVGAIDGVRRIRFGSLEPFSVDDDLLDVMAETESFCPHLHLPLQSGDDGILNAMGRGHTADEYLSLLDRIRSAMGEDVHISTDILVGFPGEDDRAFANTLSVLERGGIGRIHSFPYSPRKGTKAASLPDRPPKSIAEERCKTVIERGIALLDRYVSRWIGREESLLIEEVSGGKVSGYTPHFIRLSALGYGKVDGIVRCRITGMADGELLGEVISP